MIKYSSFKNYNYCSFSSETEFLFYNTSFKLIALNQFKNDTDYLVVQKVYHCNNEILVWKWSSDNELMPQPFWTSIFLIDGLLIDAGAPGGVDDLREFVKSLDSENRIEKCVITHNHEDHCGGGRMLQEEFKIPVFASKLAIPLLMKEKIYPNYRQMTWGANYQPFQAKSLSNSISTKSNKYIFDILEMPGHASELITLAKKDIVIHIKKI